MTVVDEVDLYDRRCPQCGAVIAPGYRLVHEQWHDDLNAALVNLGRLVARLDEAVGIIGGVA